MYIVKYYTIEFAAVESIGSQGRIFSGFLLTFKYLPFLTVLNEL